MTIQDQGQVVHLHALVAELDAYVDFLNEANRGPISLASVHGWRCPQADIDKGVAFRQRIRELHEIVGLHKDPK